MDIVEIFELREYMEFCETIINWLYSEWGRNNKMFWTKWVKSSLSLSDIPKTYVLTVNGELAGTYSLWRCDLQSCQDLYPWFGGLFVSEKFRGKYYNEKKLGEYMLEHAVKELMKMKYCSAYLFTEKSPNYYIRNGWKYLYMAPDENDHLVSVCKLSLEEKYERKDS